MELLDWYIQAERKILMTHNLRCFNEKSQSTGQNFGFIQKVPTSNIPIQTTLELHFEFMLA